MLMNMSGPKPVKLLDKYWCRICLIKILLKIRKPIEGVKESAIIGLPHKDFGEAVTAVIIPEDANNVPNEKRIIYRLKQKLANYKVPKKIIIIEQLPRNTMGKVQKNVLREAYKRLWDQEH